MKKCYKARRGKRGRRPYSTRNQEVYEFRLNLITGRVEAYPTGLIRKKKLSMEELGYGKW